MIWRKKTNIVLYCTHSFGHIRIQFMELRHHHQSQMRKSTASCSIANGFSLAEDGFIFLTRNHVSLYGCVINSNAKARPPSQMQTTSSPPLCAFANQKRYKHLTRDTHIKYAFGCISFSLTSFRCNDSSAYWIYMNVENIFVVSFVSMARPPNPSRIRRSINKERQQI